MARFAAILVVIAASLVVETPTPLLPTLKGHDKEILSIAFSPDGKILASSSNDGTIRLWSIASGRTTHILQAGNYVSSFAYNIAFSPDGSELASTDSLNGVVYFWHVATGEPARPPVKVNARLGRIAYSSDGRFVVWNGDYWVSKPETVLKIVVWDRRAGKVVRSIVLGKAPADNKVLPFRPDGRRFVLAIDDGVVLFDTKDWHIDRRPLAWKANHIVDMALSPDGTTLATADQSRGILLWDLRTGAVRRRIGDTADFSATGITRVAFSPDGTMLATGNGLGGIVALWDVRSGRQFGACEGDSAVTHAVAFSPNGKLVASGGADKVVRFCAASPRTVVYADQFVPRCTTGLERRFMADLGLREARGQSISEALHPAFEEALASAGIPESTRQYIRSVLQQFNPVPDLNPYPPDWICRLARGRYLIPITETSRVGYGVYIVNPSRPDEYSWSKLAGVPPGFTTTRLRDRSGVEYPIFCGSDAHFGLSWDWCDVLDLRTLVPVEIASGITGTEETIREGSMCTKQYPDARLDRASRFAYELVDKKHDGYPTLLATIDEEDCKTGVTSTYQRVLTPATHGFDVREVR